MRVLKLRSQRNSSDSSNRTTGRFIRGRGAVEAVGSATRFFRKAPTLPPYLWKLEEWGGPDVLEVKAVEGQKIAVEFESFNSNSF